jgi:hypothetical protein
MFGLEVAADGGDRGQQHRGIVAKPKTDDHVWNDISRHHEIGQRREQDRTDIARRRRIRGAEIGGRGVLGEGNATDGASQLPPKALLDGLLLARVALLVDRQRGQGAFGWGLPVHLK